MVSNQINSLSSFLYVDESHLHSPLFFHENYCPTLQFFSKPQLRSSLVLLLILKLLMWIYSLYDLQSVAPYLLYLYLHQLSG